MVKGKGVGRVKKMGKTAGGGDDRGLMSSAGLMRYYDTEESSVKVSPKTILLIGVFIGILVIGLQIYFGVWPPS